jgi:TatA/E family protein of Tat protein translocase
MFDNPEKLFIILLIALFIFGPQKLIGLGGAMGRAIRDFRSAVRDAHEQFSTAVEEVQKTEEAFSPSEPMALPAPDPVSPAFPISAAAAPVVQEMNSHAPAGAEDLEGPDSLASEPSSQAVLESLQRKE